MSCKRTTPFGFFIGGWGWGCMQGLSLRGKLDLDSRSMGVTSLFGRHKHHGDGTHDVESPPESVARAAMI